VSVDVKAPEGARGWTATTGYIHEVADMPTRVEDGHVVYTVSADGYVKGLTAFTSTPLIALLRVETELVELREALLDIAELFAGRLAGGDRS
jgi:hypothetical protein